MPLLHRQALKARLHVVPKPIRFGLGGLGAGLPLGGLLLGERFLVGQRAHILANAIQIALARCRQRLGALGALVRRGELGLEPYELGVEGCLSGRLLDLLFTLTHALELLRSARVRLGS